MFDRTYLSPADLEFVVLTDTHYMLEAGVGQSEFASRQHQTARAAHALRLAASIEADFVVHLGDLVQEYPESDRFAEAIEEAARQLDEMGIRPYHVAGNHDVGDKPDLTMPTNWVTAASLDQYHARFGASWYSWDAGGAHFVVLNSQIMNSDLPEREAQQAWVEQDLEAHAATPVFVFLHLSPFLYAPDEDAFGHYDNIGQPDRAWLLDLLQRHDVRAVFSGHSHFEFLNQVGDVRLHTVPSTSFTRPGFSEVFSSDAPPERGRDDAPKLGFFLVRLRGRSASVHRVRTGGEVASEVRESDERRILTRTSRDLPGSPLGISLRHPLAPTTEGVVAWPSAIRQPVRNDYSYLACVELGVRHLRVPIGDLAIASQRERIGMLRDEGVSTTVTWIDSGADPVFPDGAMPGDLVDTIEVQGPGRLTPDPGRLRHLAGIAASCGASLSIAPLLSRQEAAGKQHARTRLGYRVAELAEVDRWLGEHGARVDRILCRVEGEAEMMRCHELPPLRHIGGIDWALELVDMDEAAQAQRLAAAVFAAATLGDGRLFIEPLIDMDRTMDTSLGLLDRRCNPRRAFDAARTLNTVLFGGGLAWSRMDLPGGKRQALALRSPSETLLLLQPREEATAGALVGEVAFGERAPGAASVIRLEAGTCRPIDPGCWRLLTVAEPSLIRFDHAVAPQ